MAGKRCAFYAGKKVRSPNFSRENSPDGILCWSCDNRSKFVFRLDVVKGKVFPYSLPSVGPGADPGVQAVSPQVT